MEIFITLAVAIVGYMIVYIVFAALLKMKVATARNGGIIINVLHAIYFALVGVVFLTFAPAAIRPGRGDMWFIIVVVLAAALVAFFAIKALRANTK
jgi:hypothetical protein